MITRKDILNRAVKECMKELYSYALPHIKWEDFIEENKIYNKIKEGPKPYEFYYLPSEILDDIVNSYIEAYKLDDNKELLDIIEILKNYCEEPVIDKYIEGENGNPGYKGYEYSDNLVTELNQLFKEYFRDSEIDSFCVAQEVQNKFFEFLDMAGKFFKWNADLSNFKNSIYIFGPAPCSNKETVIENWKKYRNQDIEIDEEQIKKDYYGEELD